MLHSIPIGSRDTDVDHILVGPTGAFVLNTKHHAGASIWVGDVVLMVNSGKTHHLNRAREENRKVAERLAAKVGFPVVVHSAIVIVGARSLKDIRDPESREVTVLSSMQLVQWLKARRVTLSATQLELVRLAAEEPGTWHVDPHRAENLRVMQRFSRLQEAVGQPELRPTSPAAEVTQTETRANQPALRRTRPSRSPSRRPKQTPTQKKRSDRRAKQLAEAIAAFGFLAVVLVMTSNGTFAPFIAGIFSMLTSAP